MMKLLLILSILPGILSGTYNARTLPVELRDSLLAVEPADVADYTDRYQLESENEETIFRHSSIADWYVVDTQKGTRKALGGGLNLGKVRDAVMSPNGRYVAFVKDNNLYVHKCDFGTEVAVTKDANPDIINGAADWLYEEEFGITALFAWSPDSKQLAFVKLDEREVPTFSWDIYADTQYPGHESLRYPKAGWSNAKASVHVYDLATKAIQPMQTNKDNEDVYFPRLRWHGGALIVLRVNRDQTRMELLQCNPKSTVSHLLCREESEDYYMDYSLFDEYQWLSDGRFIVLSEKDGWRRAYLHDVQGIQLKALTPEKIDVTALYAVDESTQTLYYQAAPTPSTRQLYAVNIKKGDISQLTTAEGMHSAYFAANGKKMIECFQSFSTPNTYTFYSLKGAKLTKETVLESNSDIRDEWASHSIPEPQLLKIPNGKGQELEAMLIKPSAVSHQPSALVVMHYSGPASQRVLNRWRKRFEYALVEAGYAVLIVDARGSDCRGRAWRNETYMNLGVKEAEDLIAAARWAAQREDIDGDRIALLGWSYGGYQTLMTMSQPNHPFKAGVAIAPVTDWRLYDSGYTERYMRRPQVNFRGYDSASLLPRAKDLTGNVLIIHGTGDDNVHVQHTMQYIHALVEADKQFEMQLYPDDNHFLRQGNNSVHMHNRVLLFLQKNL
ncbi:MAG: alpha/beta fold hydrolase [Paludibacteraceae bacterium]|nr:alpha/beta fold hydrolase [Paludibacteraceae bacterium]